MIFVSLFHIIRQAHRYLKPQTNTQAIYDECKDQLYLFSCVKNKFYLIIQKESFRQGVSNDLKRSLVQSRPSFNYYCYICLKDFEKETDYQSHPNIV